MEYQAKLNENYMSVLFCISSFEVTSYKGYMIELGFRWVLRRGLEAKEKSSEFV